MLPYIQNVTYSSFRYKWNTNLKLDWFPFFFFLLVPTAPVGYVWPLWYGIKTCYCVLTPNPEELL